jgi:Na+-transporting NADH:ubiquinone oxidoreductase subunit NqrB
MTADVSTNFRAGPPPAAPPKSSGQFAEFKPFLAPILISLILVVGNWGYGILEGHWGTAVAIITSIIAETILSKFATGRWPHIASAYITGISVGILVRTPLYWPYVMCSLLAISSKYALRVGNRHLFNPSNLGISLLLLIAPAAVAPLSQQWGNEIWPLLIIFCLGMLILYTLGRVHITITYIIAFTLLSFLRSGITGRVLISELALLTAPAYQLFMFFMITDPKTTPRTKLRQCVVTVVVALVETGFRLMREIHAPYYALFVVFPITNLLELWWDGRKARAAKPAPASGTA